ncbi:hypothetical protein [Saccharospirillum impatiens]|nr:hypothetical protein [Saccharospirillum impatiens]
MRPYIDGSGSGDDLITASIADFDYTRGRRSTGGDGSTRLYRID